MIMLDIFLIKGLFPSLVCWHTTFERVFRNKLFLNDWPLLLLLFHDTLILSCYVAIALLVIFLNWFVTEGARVGTFRNFFYGLYQKRTRYNLVTFQVYCRNPIKPRRELSFVFFLISLASMGVKEEIQHNMAAVVLNFIPSIFLLFNLLLSVGPPDVLILPMTNTWC